MNDKLEEYLIKKFPDFFIDCDKSPKQSCMAWGCSHGDGWFLLLNSLCTKIKGHIDSHNQSVKWYEEDEKSAREKGSPVPERPEWAKDRITFKFEQIKEKFGALRIYYTGGDEEIMGYIDFAESLSRRICEFCGKFDTTVGSTTRGWIQSVCKECVEKHKTEFATTKGWSVFKENDEVSKLFLQVMEDEEKNKGKEMEIAMNKVREIAKRNEPSSS